MIPVLISVAILIFTIMYFVPGDPVQIILGDYFASPEQIAETRARLGLDKSFWEQLGTFLLGLTHLDFGKSYIYGNEVGPELLYRFPKTLALAGSSLVLIIIIGIPLGIWCALNAGKLIDRALMVVTLLLNSMPSFWLGLLLIILFTTELKLLPSTYTNSPKSFIMPVIACSASVLAAVSRQTRSSMLEVIRSDYVTTARSKGLSENAVIYKHVLPNALVPIITVCGTRLGVMIGGSTVIEAVFSIPGIGQYMVNAINSRDYPVVRGSILTVALTFSIIMLVMDLIYAFVDPRIKAQYARAKKRPDKA